MKPGTLLICASVLASLTIAFLLVDRGAGAADAEGVYWNEEIAGYVRSKVAATYVDELSSEQEREAFYRAMDAYLELDPYSGFIPPSEQQEWREGIEGKYAGLGIKIEQVDEGLMIVGVLPGGPAAVAGLTVGDTIVRAGDVPLGGIDLDQVTDLLKGEPNSTVRIAYRKGPRPEDGPSTNPVTELAVVRGVIRPPTVYVRRVGDHGQFGVVRLTDFAEETVDDFGRAVESMMEDGIEGLVLDLRHNGGGVLNVALKIADRFLRQGVLVRMEGRARDSNKQHSASKDANDVPDLPLVVLVNGYSASASEIVAGALQDHRRALLVGTRTYGKFLVQQISEIPGTRAAIKLTTSRYYTPSGRSYQSSGGNNGDPAGLFPDVIIPLTAKQNEMLGQFFVNQEEAVWGQETRFPEVAADYVDPQLQRAVDLLSGDVALRNINRGKPKKG